MRYIPNTKAEQKQMLSQIGAKSMEALFSAIPGKVRINSIGVVPPSGISEQELKESMENLSKKNLNTKDLVSFLGGGAYNHFIPSTVKHLIGRSEFYTAYTPYQPELSQGMLQSIFEYQSMICSLAGMDAANASMYDGATALAAAASLAVHFTGKSEILVSKAVNPNYRKVLNTYAAGSDWKIVEFGYQQSFGVSDFDDAAKKISDKTACLILSDPNFFGCLEDIEKFSALARSKGALSIASVDPISLGMLKRPGDVGVDVIVGEGQSLGLPQNFGGPYLGIFAVKKDYLRLMPGRIVGETVDTKGRRGYVLTLQAREQHIRREKAFSNICSNEALCALAATVYLATMGKSGLREVANQCLQKSNYAKKKLSKLVAFKSPSFKEFVIKLDKPVEQINQKLLENKIIGGLDLGRDYPELKGHMLLCITEMIKKADIDRLAGSIISNNKT
ncbi:MAG: aminomethyl-transferring glycine dehydrogenase subunit GcvPA [bacterium]